MSSSDDILIGDIQPSMSSESGAPHASTSSSTIEELQASLDNLDIDYSDIETRYAVDVHESLDDVIVIDGVPVVGKDREEKLKETIAKRFKQTAGLNVDVQSMNLPYGDDGQSKG